MNTHIKGFYEDLTKIIFQLSSNIIKYTPYLFFCNTTTVLVEMHKLILCHHLALRDKSNKFDFATSKDSDQPGKLPQSGQSSLSAQEMGS